MIKQLLSFLIILILLPFNVTFSQMSEFRERLKNHVIRLSEDIGQRNIFNYNSLIKAQDYIADAFKEFGYEIEFQDYNVEGRICRNIIAEKQGSTEPEKIILIGAHYDSVWGSPGADDNASGVAVLLELASIFSKELPKKTIRFVAFVNEEPPFYKQDVMGSFVYARSCKEKKEKILMICLESLGYFSQEKNSQQFPLGFMRWFYPDEGNFIAVVANFGSRSLIKKIKTALKKNSSLPIEGLATFSFVTGVDFSDHWSFWRHGYKACMITDTAFYRNPYYHTSEDTYEKLDYESLAELVRGLSFAIRELAN